MDIKQLFHLQIGIIFLYRIKTTHGKKGFCLRINCNCRSKLSHFAGKILQSAKIFAQSSLIVRIGLLKQGIRKLMIRK